jgi:outer membrane immunogenic protein
VKTLLAFVSVAAVGAISASAADAAPGYDWTGVYVGAHVGVAHGRITATDVTEPNGGFFTDLVPAGTEGFKFHKTALAGGAHVGAQYELGKFVLGAEGAWTATGIRQTIVSPYFPESDTESAKVRNYMALVGRAGFAADRFMIYAKGGYASGKVNFRARDSESLVTYTKNDRQNGYVLGGGVDYALSNHLIFGVDFSHVKLGAKTSTGRNVFDDGTFGDNPETYRTRATMDIFMARLSFKFGGGHAPQLAPPAPPAPPPLPPAPATQTCADGSVILASDACPVPLPPAPPPPPPPSGERG